MTNVKYQVFISSTYTDLVEERSKLYESLMLRRVYIPIGMENFEASNKSSWDLIRRRIDECDYMVVIIGDRSGSVGPDGTSFTQMEYEYAKRKNIPVVALLKQNMTLSATSPAEVENARLVIAFREKCKADRNVSHWLDAADLANKATAAVDGMVRDKPGVGWIRASEAGSDLPFNLAEHRATKRISGKWGGYFTENGLEGPQYIEEEVRIRQIGNVVKGSHKCLSDKRGAFYFHGYIKDEMVSVFFSYYPDRYEDGGIYNLLISEDGNWMEGYSTWKAWPSGRIEGSHYILHKLDVPDSAKLRQKAIEAVEADVAALLDAKAAANPKD